MEQGKAKHEQADPAMSRGHGLKPMVTAVCDRHVAIRTDCPTCNRHAGPMMTDVYTPLLDAARDSYQASPALTAFAPFPDDITPQPVPMFHTKSLDLLTSDAGLAGPNAALTQAIKDAAPHAHWRETYKGTNIGQDFMDRFGCYSIIGNGGPYASERLWMWMVYMPAHLYYPWHHHPAEEMYYVVAGQARFMRQGARDETLQAGNTCFHASNQPHAMETDAQPVLCLVVWRNGFETAPVLASPDLI